MRALFVASTLLALAACSNAATSTANNGSAGATRVAAENADSNAHSVSAVSDALGQRLDNMLAARQTSR